MNGDADPSNESMGPKLQHLEFIQRVIDRMGSNSFRLKGWSVVLISALLVLVAREGRASVTLFALVPILVFWGLDAYFLCQERLYRALYGHVRTLSASDIDFSMDAKQFAAPRLRWRRVLVSRTLWPFYCVLAVAVIVAVLIVQPERGCLHGT